MDIKQLFKFLNDLSNNNNREWFTKNKDRYETARNEFIVFLDELIAEISGFDSSLINITGKNCAFRIYRDVRFSHDKSPYKTHFGAMIMPSKSKTEIHSTAGYYVHLEPGKSMLAGGAYMPPGEWLKSIRKEIAFNSVEFRQIVENKNFKKYFGTVEGEKLQRPPAGFDTNHPEIDLLKHKSFLAVHYLSDKDIIIKGNVKYFSEVFKAMQPFNKFLNEAGI